MKKILFTKETNQGTFRVIENPYFDKVYYTIQEKYKFLWFTQWRYLEDHDFPCSSIFIFNSMEDVDRFFSTGKIKYPGTVIA